MFERVKEDTKKKLESACEQYIWLTIDGLGDFVWRMNHDIADGRIPSTPSLEENILKMHETIIFATTQIKRFGPEVLDKDNKPTKEYWDWYDTWKKYVEGLSDKDFHKLGDLAAGETSAELDYMRPDPKDVERFDLIDLDD